MLTFLVQMVVGSTAILILAVFVAPLLRRASAAARHACYCSVMIALLLLPLLIPLLPTVTPVMRVTETRKQKAEQLLVLAEPVLVEPILTEPTPAPFVMMSEPMIPEHQTVTLPVIAEPIPEVSQEEATTIAATIPIPWDLLLIATLLCGTVLRLMMLTASLVTTRNMVQNSVTFELPRGCTTAELCQKFRFRRDLEKVLTNDRVLVPFAAKIFRPVIFLPTSMQRERVGKLRLVLMHEMAHIARHDVFWQLLSRMMLAVYWFHPLVWLLAMRIRREREFACDDAVLLHQENPEDYASVLLDISESLHRTPVLLPGCTVAMAQTPQIENRIRAILDTSRVRKPLGRLTGSLLVLTACTLTAFAGMFSPIAREEVVVQDEVVAKPENTFLFIPSATERTYKPVEGDTPQVRFQMVIAEVNKETSDKSMTQLLFSEKKIHGNEIGNSSFSNSMKSMDGSAFDDIEGIAFSASSELMNVLLKALENRINVLRRSQITVPDEEMVTITVGLKNEKNLKIDVVPRIMDDWMIFTFTVERNEDYRKNGSGQTLQYCTRLENETMAIGVTLKSDDGVIDKDIMICVTPWIVPPEEKLKKEDVASKPEEVVQVDTPATSTNIEVFFPPAGTVPMPQVPVSSGSVEGNVPAAIFEMTVAEVNNETTDKPWTQQFLKEIDLQNQQNQDKASGFTVSSQEQFRDFLRDLEKRKKITILSRPQIRALDNELSTVLVGSEEKNLMVEVVPRIMGDRVLAAITVKRDVDDQYNAKTFQCSTVATLQENVPLFVSGLIMKSDDGEVGKEILLCATAKIIPPIPPKEKPKEEGVASMPESKPPQKNSENVNVLKVAGTVVDTDDKPVNGAIVEFGFVKPLLTATSDAEGRFHFELPTTFRGTMLRFYSRLEDGSRQGFAGCYYPALKDEKDYPFKEPKIVLQPKITMTGKVVDGEGLAIAGATVVAMAYARELARKVTDDDGTFALEVPDGTLLEHLFAVKANTGFDYHLYHGDSHQPIWVDGEPMKFDYTEPVTLTLGGAKRIVVVVSTPEGNPAEGVRILPWLLIDPRKPKLRDGLDWFNTMGSDLLSATTDKNGVAVFDWFPEWQEREVSFAMTPPVKPGEAMEYASQHAAIQYYPKSEATQIKHTLIRLAPRIEGTLRDAEGKPVSGVYVRMDVDEGGWHTAFGEDSYSDEQGKIGFNVQTGRKYRCMIEDPRWDAPAIYDIRPVHGATTPKLEFVVRPTVRLFGRLTMGADRQPLEDTRLFLANDHKAVRDSTQTGADGSFEFFAGPGTYRITHQFIDEETIKTFTVPENCEEFEIDLHLNAVQ